ncbi:hypothetical protein BaRGS_00017322 [Batillaria attramentaria]|uniref:Uncharacterized protein n=1 Tax=Batillaria attramentaria TaxID=370345 RepID=A0ABD0KX39_9CAEN
MGQSQSQSLAYLTSLLSVWMSNQYLLLRTNWVCGYGTLNWVCGYGTLNWVCGYGTLNWVCGYGTLNWVCGYGTLNWVCALCGYGTLNWVCGYGTLNWALLGIEMYMVSLPSHSMIQKSWSSSTGRKADNGMTA